MRTSVTMSGIIVLFATCVAGDELYYASGRLAGSLRSQGPLPIYDAKVGHIWNRLFSALYVRESFLPAEKGGKPIKRFEGGDYIDFLAWGGSKYWSNKETLDRIERLLDEFLTERTSLLQPPLKRALMLRDLWAAYDFLIGQNIRRVGPLETRRRRAGVCSKLARAIRSLTLERKQIQRLPATYPAAIRSGRFAARQDVKTNHDYLPHELLTNSDKWVEIDFFQPNLHEDLYDRFITLHARAYRGRSYFRIFYRFPGGRAALTRYLKDLQGRGVNWKQAAQDGFILLRKEAPQIPVGTEVLLAQFMMTLDRALQPTPTNIVESIRHRTFRNVSGGGTPSTNTGIGMHISEYTLKRRKLFDNLRDGGLQREPDDMPLYRIIFQPPNAPDWGTDGRKVLFQQCADCHMTPKADRAGVHSLPSIVNMGGFNAGAQLGVAHALDPKQSAVRGRRVARWKKQHETYRRLLEQLEAATH